MWNKLPEEVDEAITITIFKRHLGRCMVRISLEEYGPNGRQVG